MENKHQKPSVLVTVIAGIALGIFILGSLFVGWTYLNQSPVSTLDAAALDAFPDYARQTAIDTLTLMQETNKKLGNFGDITVLDAREAPNPEVFGYSEAWCFETENISNEGKTNLKMYIAWYHDEWTTFAANSDKMTEAGC